MTANVRVTVEWWEDDGGDLPDYRMEVIYVGDTLDAEGERYWETAVATRAQRLLDGHKPPPRRRNDPEWVDTKVGEMTITAVSAGGVPLVPDGRGGLQPIPDDWEEQNGWSR